MTEEDIQFLWDGYVAHGFIHMNDKKLTGSKRGGKLYVFTACADDGTPIMDVYYNSETKDVEEIKRRCNHRTEYFNDTTFRCVLCGDQFPR